MTQPPADKESVLADVSELDLTELLKSTDSPLLASLQRIATDADDDAIAGFADGIT